jgi:large subunit ribosomal protein L3
MKEYPGRVLKGKKMPGRMGTDRITLAHRAILVSDTAKGILAVKGPVPGPNGSTVFITIESKPESQS